MNKLKVLHITQCFGGVQTYIMNIISNSDKILFEHAIISPESAFINQFHNYEVKYFKISITRNISFKDFSSLVQIIKVIQLYKPDVLHVHSAKAGALGRIAALITNKKVVFTPNAFSYLGFVGSKRKFYLYVERFLKPLTDLLLAVSKSEADRAQYEIGYKIDKIKVVPNSINIDSFSYDNNYDLKNNVGMIGRLIWQKNPHFFIDIAEQVHIKRPSTTFYLLGVGYLDFLQTEIFDIINIRKASNYIKILKWGETDIVNFIKSLDVFILTSRYEGLPFSLLEAMALGVPTIATNVDGNKDVIDDCINGFLIEQNDLQLAVERVVELIDDKDKRIQIGRAGRQKIIDEFNILYNIKLIEHIYLSAMK